MKLATIATVQVREGLELRVVVDHFRGRDLVHIRRWYEADGRWKPGKGVTLPPELLPWLQDAVNRTVAAALVTGDLELEDFEHHELDPPPELLEV